MKSIIIIIAIFLVTLTAKADWVKSGELDSLYLGDAPITFSKYSPDYTKFVTYSAQDSTLRLWDLATGKVIKERTFEWAYKYDVCEFDFESEMFIFHYVKPMQNNIAANFIAYLNFSTQLIEREINRSSIEYYPPTESYSYFIAMSFVNKNLILYYINSWRQTPNGTQTERSSGMQTFCKFKNDSLFIIGSSANSLSSIRYFQGGSFSYTNNSYRWYGTHAGPVNESEERRGIYIDFNGIVFNQEDVAKVSNNKYTNSNVLKDNYPYFTNLVPLDIAFKYFVFSDKEDNIKFFSGEQNKPTNLGIRYNSKEIRNLLLIENPQYSIFHKEKDTVNIYDNKNQNIVIKYFLPEGNLNYDWIRKYIYSYSKEFRNIYKKSKIMKFSAFLDLWTNKSKYIIGDSVKIFANISSNVSDISIDINGAKLTAQTIMTFKPTKSGFYNASLSYLEDGIRKTFKKDTLFQVKDSLKINYKITNTYNNNVNYPFYCEANSNDPETVFTWGYTWCKMGYYPDRNNMPLPENQYYDNYKKGNQVIMAIPHEVNLKTLPFVLKAENGSQTIIQKIDLVVNPNLVIKFNKYKGMAPFTFKAVFEKTILLHPIIDNFNFCQMVFNKKQLIIDKFINIEKDGNAIDTITQTITKPGIYKIILRYSNGYEVVHDSVITVYDPTDIQDFAKRKYIFKQDADGIYCQLDGEGEVSLYDNVGRLVSTYQIENERYIRKEDLERGVYFLSIQTNGNVYHEKVLVE